MAERENRFAKKQKESVSLRDLTSRGQDVPNTSEIVADIQLDLMDFDENNEFLFGYKDLDRIKNTMDESKLVAPPIVYKKDDGRYLIASGHTRVKALKDMGKKKVTCQIMPLPANPDQIKKNLIYLNTQRREAPLYVARNIKEYERIIRSEGFKGNVEQELIKQFGYKKSQLYRYKKILSMPEDLQQLCIYEEIAWQEIIEIYDRIPEDKIDEFCKKVIDLLNQEGHVSAKQIDAFLEEKKEKTTTNNSNEDVKEEKAEKLSHVYKKVLSIKYGEEIKIKNKDKAQIKKQAEELKDYLDKIIEACK